MTWTFCRCASLNWTLLCIGMLNCCQKLFQFSTSPLKVGIFILGSFWSLSSLSIWKLRSKRVLARAELRSRSSRSHVLTKGYYAWDSSAPCWCDRPVSLTAAQGKYLGLIPRSVTQWSSWLTSEYFPCGSISYVRTGRVLRPFLDSWVGPQ